MAIDVGSPAINRSSDAAGAFTWLNVNNPANDTGLIDTIEVYAKVTMSNPTIGIWFLISGNTYECRSIVTPGTATGGVKTIYTGLSLAVEVGDYIGIYGNGAGNTERDTSGGGGAILATGNKAVVGLQTVFGAPNAGILSLNGAGPSAGGEGNALMLGSDF